jgi:hypothetical protein
MSTDPKPALVSDDPSVDVTRWLQEVGRRKAPRSALAVPGELQKPSHALEWREVTYLSLLGVAYLEFFFVDVFLQIFSLRSLIVFVVHG